MLDSLFVVSIHKATRTNQGNKLCTVLCTLLSVNIILYSLPLQWLKPEQNTHFLLYQKTSRNHDLRMIFYKLLPGQLTYLWWMLLGQMTEHVAENRYVTHYKYIEDLTWVLMFFFNLSNELRKNDKMRGLPSILSFFRNEFDKIKNIGAWMLDYIYHMK